VTIPLTRSAAGITLRVRVVPRAGRTGVAGTREDALLVRLAAAPVDGAANDALVAFLAELFDRPRRDITLVSGHTTRDKRIAIAGTDETAIAAQLDAVLRTEPRRTL
jgi:uncharacterized protein (TIGR00251 family)